MTRDQQSHWPHPRAEARSPEEFIRLSAVDSAHLVFVFGSNLAGRHAGGAARDAVEIFGAITGKGYGWHGRSYAVPTMDVGLHTLPLHIIKGHVERFLAAAAAEPFFTFYVTAIGTGIAAIPHERMAPLFRARTDNVLLPPEWLAILNPPVPVETPL